MKVVQRMYPYHEDDVNVTLPRLHVVGKEHVAKRLSQIWRDLSRNFCPGLKVNTDYES